MPITIDGSNGITQAGEFNSDSSFGFKNRIINGAMVIDQRNAGASVTLSNSAWTFPVDRFSAFEDTSGTMTAQQVSDAPAGFTNSIKFTTTVADSSLSASERVMARQTIEGFNTADLMFGTANAKTVTLSFWVKSSLTGTFGGSLRNADSNRSYPYTYTISSANTWEYKTITIAGDTTGTWGTTNGSGIILFFGLGVGSDNSGTAGAWASADLYSATGATSVIGTLNATWQVTGVQLEVGSTATSFDYRPYGTELALCQRYYEQVTGSTAEQRPFGIAYAASTTSVRLAFYYKQQKRATPTIAGTTARVSNATDGTSPTIELIGPDTAIIGYTTSGLTANNAYVIFNRSGNADFIAFSSEL
jgi:hypothetical protein